MCLDYYFFLLTLLSSVLLLLLEFDYRTLCFFAYDAGYGSYAPGPGTLMYYVYRLYILPRLILLLLLSKEEEVVAVIILFLLSLLLPCIVPQRIAVLNVDLVLPSIYLCGSYVSGLGETSSNIL